MSGSRKTAVLTAAVLSFSMLALTGCGKTDDEAGVPAETETSAAEGVGDTAPMSQVWENPDWSYGQVAIGGGGFVTGIINTCEPGLFYARTDVGGAYRWDVDKNMWVSLSYNVSDDDKGLLGIDGIAVDPNDAATVYLLAGTEYFSGGKSCVFISHDYGEHFEVVDVSGLIKVHGNGMGRGNGERIAVDPNDPDIIFCGGRTGGMIKSEDAGAPGAVRALEVSLLTAPPTATVSTLSCSTATKMPVGRPPGYTPVFPGTRRTISLFQRTAV